MEIFDISVPIRPGMITYPGDPQVQMERVESIEPGDIANLTRLDFGVHTGTHVDAPIHFIEALFEAGIAAIEGLDLRRIEPGLRGLRRP